MFANVIQNYSRLENNATRREIKNDETKTTFVCRGEKVISRESKALCGLKEHA